MTLSANFKNTGGVLIGQAIHALQLGDVELLHLVEAGAQEQVVRPRGTGSAKLREGIQQLCPDTPRLRPVKVEVNEATTIGTKAQAKVQVGIGQEGRGIVCRHGVRIVLARRNLRQVTQPDRHKTTGEVSASGVQQRIQFGGGGGIG